MSTQYPLFPDYLRNVCLQLVFFDLDLLLFRSGHLDQIDVFALDYFQGNISVRGTISPQESFYNLPKAAMFVTVNQISKSAKPHLIFF